MLLRKEARSWWVELETREQVKVGQRALRLIPRQQPIQVAEEPPNSLGEGADVDFSDAEDRGIDYPDQVSEDEEQEWQPVYQIREDKVFESTRDLGKPGQSSPLFTFDTPFNSFTNTFPTTVWANSPLLADMRTKIASVNRNAPPLTHGK